MSERIEGLARQLFEIVNDFGPEWDALCPVHDDSNPSARVNPAKNVWYCHGCHEGGSITWLAQDQGYVVEHEVEDWMVDVDLDEALRSLETDSEPTPYPDAWLARYGGDTSYWTQQRGFSARAVKHWSLGSDPVSGYATYPMRNLDGEVLGVSMRATRPEHERKHRHPRGLNKSALLYGSFESRELYEDGPNAGVLCLTEGALDAIAMWDIGYAAVAQLGSSLSDRQLELLRAWDPDELCLCYDADAAGRQSTIEAWMLLDDLVLTQAAIPPGCDPLDLDEDERQATMNERRDLLAEPTYRRICASKRVQAKRKTPGGTGGRLRATKP